MPSGHGGAKVGVRIAGLVSQSIVHTHSKLLHIKHKLAMMIFSDISDIISEEVHQGVGSIIRQLHSDLPDESIANPLLKFMATQHGQLQAVAGTMASASGLFSSVGEVINNELSPSVRGLLASNPHMLPDTGTIANLAARGLAQINDAVSSIAQQGIDTGWGNALVKMNEAFPDSGTMLDMVRRGLIGRDNFIEWSHRSGMTASTAEAVLGLLNVPLSPADAALAVLRGNIDMGTALKHAAAYGVDAGDFQILIDNTGEPLGLMELLEARRRGFIDDARLTRGIIQSRIRNEWVDVAKAIAFSPMSTADAVNAVVQNHLTQAQASAIASQNGLEPGAFDTLVQTAGEPLSRTEMEQLYNRGQVTEAQVKQALNESRLKPKYTDLAFQLHVKLLPIRNLAEAVEYGVMPMHAAVQEAMKNGYSEADATTLIQAASARKLQTYRHGIVTAAESLYVDNALSLDDAMAVAKDAGFNDAEATAIFKGAEYKRQARMLSAAVSAVRSKYIMHHLDQPTASSLLDGIGIISGHRDELIAIWSIERSANVATLTEAQIIKAYKKGTIQSDETITRLQQKGFSDADISILMTDA
jgi:hypothetical protein